MTTLDIYIEERLKNEIVRINISNSKTIEIFLNQGSSFGSNHSTTLLSVEALKFLSKKENSITNALDLGSGSGILSILMRKLEISKVFACEIDEYARNESILNFESNFNNKIDYPKFIQNPLHKKYYYDLIIANISGSFLPNNFLEISNIITKNGYLIISGFNCEKEEKYSIIAKECNLLPIKTFKDSSWISIIFKKNEINT